MTRFKQFILKAFELKPEEYQKFILLFFHSFCLGLFVAFYFVPANSLFIKNFGSEQLPLAYIVSGVVGYLSTYLYSRIQKKVQSRNLFLGALVFMLIVTLVSPILISLVHHPLTEKWLSFYVFIWAWPIISLTNIEQGGLSLKLLNLRQVKRLYGLINIGGVLASGIGYLLIPALLTFLIHPYHLLYIGAAGVIASIVILVSIYKQFPESKGASDEMGEGHLTYRSLIKDKYFKLIFVAAIFSMMVIYFTDFAFLATIKVQREIYNWTPKEVAFFLAIIFGVLKFGELVMSYFSSRILSQYGVKLGLSILPLASFGLIILAAVAVVVFGPTSLVFFGIIVFNKVMERIVRRALDDPSFNILYQPLPDEQKLSIQTKVGVIMQMAIGIAGVILFIFSQILKTATGYDLMVFPFLFLPLLGAWSFVALKLYQEYKERIRQILKEKNSRQEFDTDIYGKDILTKRLKDENLPVVEMVTKLLAETDPRSLELYAVNLLKTNEIGVVEPILKIIDPTYRQEFKKVIIRINETTENPELKRYSSEALALLDFSDIANVKDDDIVELSKSESETDRYLVIKYLFLKKTVYDDEIILRLLADNHRKIKRSAIKLAGKRNSPTLNQRLIELLKDPEYVHYVSSTLLELGEKLVDELDTFFRKETSITILHRIIELYGKIGSPKTKALLVSHINFPNKDIQISVIKALVYCQYQVNIKERPIIKEKLDEIVENILWVFLAINDLESEKNTLKLIQSLDIERIDNFNTMFNLLSFMYQPATIDLIKQNIIGENIIFALEIIENFISQDIKVLIIPLIDKLSVSVRLKKLQNFYPHHKRMKFQDRLKDILTREYNKVDLWTVAKAIELLGKTHKKTKTDEVKTAEVEVQNRVDIWTKERINELLTQIRKSEMPDEIFVCLYHPDELVSSTSAKIIYEENPVRCINYLKQMPEDKKELIHLLESNDEDNLTQERVKLVKRVPVFFSIPENTLVKLARLFRAYKFKKGEKVSFFNEEKNSEDIILLSSGTLSGIDESGNEKSFLRNNVIVRGVEIDDSVEYLIVKKDAVVLKSNRFDYFNLLTDEVDIIVPMIQSVKIGK